MDAEYSYMLSMLNANRNNESLGSITSLAFDPIHELLWAGTSTGHISSLTMPEAHKYTAFQTHFKSGVEQLIISEGMLLSLSKTELVVRSPLGPVCHTFRSDDMVDLCGMTIPSRYGHSVIACGRQSRIVTMDLSYLKVVSCETGPSETGYVGIKSSPRFVFAGSDDGKIHVLDPRTLKSQQTIDAHSGGLIDFDVDANLVCSCGYSQSRAGAKVPDPFIKIFDMRAMRSLIPAQCSSRPDVVRFVSSPHFQMQRIAVVTKQGLLQMFDPGMSIANPNAVLQPSAIPTVCSLASSSSTQLIALGDRDGGIHLFGSGDQFVNSYSQDLVYADPIEFHQPIYIDDASVSLASFPFAIPTDSLPPDVLASDFSITMSKTRFREEPVVPVEALSQRKLTGFITSIPNKEGLKCNQIPYKSVPGSGIKSQSETAQAADERLESIPQAYRRVDITYSKLGVEDFNFQQYNQTDFCGLEIHIPNAYCNSMLQVLYFIAPFRAAMQNHACDEANCLSCEIGFLFHMLDQVPGRNCQATNFLRCFRTIRQVEGLSLILNDDMEISKKADYQRLIQGWHTFVLGQVDHETRAKNDPTQKTSIQELWGTVVKNRSECQSCSSVKEREFESFAFTLQTPDVNSNNNNNSDGDHIPFSSILQDTLSREETLKSWCDKCQQYKLAKVKRLVKSLPNILALNCGSDKESTRLFFANQTIVATSPEIAEVPDVSPGDLRDTSTSSASASASSEEQCPYGLTCPRRSKCQLKHPSPNSIPMCKFGSKCSRKVTCRFRHEVVQEAVAPKKPATTANSSTTIRGKAQTATPKQLRTWLPMQLRIRTNGDGSLQVEQSMEEPLTPATTLEQQEGCDVYDLVSVVAHIHDPSCQNLVAHIRISSFYHQMKEGIDRTSWLLFNDFAVSPVSSFEAIHYNPEWKMPSVMYYMKRNLPPTDVTVRMPLSVFQHRLLHDRSMTLPSKMVTKCVPLRLDEEIPPGCLVALDAEFVSLRHEEAELRSNGFKATLKPSQMACARISLLRGWGPLIGVPFVDDYIHTTEQIDDYLTQYSGIQEGDLDPKRSSKHLTTLKNSYSKIRYLEHIGAKFVGHGLKKDFRVINCQPPEHLIVDTVELYYLPGQRKISLRFLAWHLLRLEMQTSVLGHDSIEDALVALKLYHHYCELQKEPGLLQKTMHQIYETGRQMKWKLPSEVA